MLKFIFTGLESSINHLLQGQPDALNKLQALAGHTFLLSIHDWQFNMVLACTKTGITLSQEIEKPNVTISGTLKELSQLLQGQRLKPGSSLSITGDIELAQKLQHVMRDIQIDWEGELSRYIGNSPAYWSMKLGKRILEKARGVKNILQDNLAEFVIHEALLAPASFELDTFYAEVSELRDDVERLAVRIQQLQREKI